MGLSAKVVIKIEIKNLEGKKVEDLELSSDVFGLEINEDLIHQAYTVQYSNRREVLAHTKNRSERKGSTRKPWKQKGTGRARAGSVRSPIWRKGGIVFGPTNERNFDKKINKKMNQLAIRMVLSGKIRDNELVVLDNFNIDQVKTKEMAKALKNLGLEKAVLMGFMQEESEKIRASRNLKNVENIQVSNLNVLDMLNSKYLLMSKAGIQLLEEKYRKKAKSQSSKVKSEVQNSEVLTK